MNSINIYNTLMDLIYQNQKTSRILKDLRNKLPGTYQHSICVGILCGAYVSELQMADDAVKIAIQAGLLHDIGKLYVPSDIVAKTDSLTDEERHILNCHPYDGYKKLLDCGLPSTVCDGALYHHVNYGHDTKSGLSYIGITEKQHMDEFGTPIPRGLNIPFTARLIRVMDSYDAMRQKRNYDAAKLSNEALEEIVKNKDVLYDPTIANYMALSGALWAIDIVRPQTELQVVKPQMELQAVQSCCKMTTDGVI